MFVYLVACFPSPYSFPTIPPLYTCTHTLSHRLIETDFSCAQCSSLARQHALFMYNEMWHKNEDVAWIHWACCHNIHRPLCVRVCVYGMKMYGKRSEKLRIHNVYLYAKHIETKFFVFPGCRRQSYATGRTRRMRNICTAANAAIAAACTYPSRQSNAAAASHTVSVLYPLSLLSSLLPHRWH